MRMPMRRGRCSSPTANRTRVLASLASCRLHNGHFGD
jgi:hypothetical protein